MEGERKSRASLDGLNVGLGYDDHIDGDYDHNPYIGDDESPTEISFKGVLLGITLSCILGATNVYGGLLAGVTTSASIPAAILSMGILKFFDSNILENNQVQTAASAGESLAAGVIFTLPAMYLFDSDPESPSEGWDTYLSPKNYMTSLVLCLFGGILGVLFSVPIRKALIVEKEIDPPLTFPEGIATAKVLIKGHESNGDPRGFKALLSGTAVGSLFSIINEGLGVVKSDVSIGWFAGEASSMVLEFGMSPITMSIGYIVGLRVAFVMLLGSVLQFLMVIPITQTIEDIPCDNCTAVDLSYTYWSGYTRNMGVGAMLLGSFAVLWDIRNSLFRGVAVGFKAFTSSIQDQNEAEIGRTSKEFPMKYVLIAVLVCVVLIYIMVGVFLDDFLSALPLALLVLILGFLFSSVAGFNAGLVGSSNNPVSGVTISTILITAFVVRGLLGADNPLGAPVSVLVGTVVCCAAAISGDNLQDLKAGHLLGATPDKQVKMQLIGVSVASFIMAPVLQVLATTYGFGSGPGELEAPQGRLMKTVSEGVIFNDLPFEYIAVGAAIGLGVVILDKFLAHQESTFRVPVMAFAIGFYLPMYLGAGVFAGSLVAALVKKESQLGLLHAAGMITGYGLVGLLIAVILVIMSFVDPDASLKLDVDLSEGASITLSFIQLLLVFASLYYYARVPDDEESSEIVPTKEDL